MFPVSFDVFLPLCKKLCWKNDIFHHGNQQTFNKPKDRWTRMSTSTKSQNQWISSSRRSWVKRLCLPIRCVELVFQDDCKWFRWVSSILQKVFWKYFFHQVIQRTIDKPSYLRHEWLKSAKSQNQPISSSRTSWAKRWCLRCVELVFQDDCK